MFGWILIATHVLGLGVGGAMVVNPRLDSGWRRTRPAVIRLFGTMILVGSLIVLADKAHLL